MIKWFANIELSSRAEPKKSCFCSQTWMGPIPEGPRAKITQPYAGGTHLFKCEFWKSREAKDKHCCVFKTSADAEEWAEKLFKIHGGKT